MGGIPRFMTFPRESVTDPVVTVEAIDPEAQTLTVRIVYDAPWNLNPYCGLAVYQMSPGKNKTPTCWRDTRLMTWWEPTGTGGGTEDVVCNVRWPLISGTTTRVFWRTRADLNWRSWGTQNIFVPYVP